MTTLRKLEDLSCKQLKEELRARELRIFCAKEKMRASLRQNLVDEGEDPETYLFEVEPDISELLNSMNHSLDKLILNVQGQINSLRERSSTSFNNNESLLIEDCGCTGSNKEYVDLNEKHTDEQKETVEAIEEVCYATETFAISTFSATTTRTEQNNFEPASEPVALDLKNLCQFASAYEESLKFDCCIQAVSKNCTCGASRRECKRQETHQQDLEPVDFDISVFNSERSTEGGQKNSVRRDAAADELLHIRRYPRALQACLPDAAGFGELSNNLISWGPAATLQSIHRESLLKQRVEPTAVMTIARTYTASLLGTRLPSVVTERKARQRKLCPLNQRQINWRRRRKRHTQTTMQMAPSRRQDKLTVAPTDRPPPASINLHIYCRIVNFVRDGQIWRRRKRHLQRALWMALWRDGSMLSQSVTSIDRPPPTLTNREHVSFRDEKTKVGVML